MPVRGEIGVEIPTYLLGGIQKKAGHLIGDIRLRTWLGDIIFPERNGSARTEGLVLKQVVVDAAEIDAAVRAVIAQMSAENAGSPTMREMGAIMKNVMARFAGARIDGKQVSEAVKKALGG